jgi:hypothetical protein
MLVSVLVKVVGSVGKGRRGEERSEKIDLALL